MFEVFFLDAKIRGGKRKEKQKFKDFRARCSEAVLDFDAFTGLTDMDIRVAMRNAAGPKPQMLGSRCNMMQFIRYRSMFRNTEDVLT